MAKKVAYTNIAHRSIQSRRETIPVPLPPYGTLHDYVPFYFAPRSPMLYSIHQGNVEGYDRGQRYIIHLVSNVQDVLQSNRKFVFTDGHAIVLFTEFYNDINDFDKIDWEIMKVKYWYDTNEDPDRKRRRQAEFLVYNFFPWTLIKKIGVMDIAMARMVKNIIEDCDHQPKILVKKDWYY